METLKDKVVLITGCFNQTFVAIAKEFVRLGSIPVIASKRTTLSKELIERELAGNDYHVLNEDLDEKENIKKAFNEIISRYGRLDIVINNSEFFYDKKFEEIELNEWKHSMEKNLKSLYYISKESFLIMIKQKFGRIVNVIYSSESLIQSIGQIDLETAKQGVIGFTKCLAREGAMHNILANNIIAGFVENHESTDKFESRLNDLKKGIPLNRFVKPEEIANSVLFLSSGLCSFMTGTSLNLTGGIMN